MVRISVEYLEWLQTQGVHIGDAESCKPYDAVKRYFCELYDSRAEVYTCDIMTTMLFTILGDYLDTCDDRTAFLEQWRRVCDFDTVSAGESLCTAFSLVQVKADERYINGFQGFQKYLK